MMKVIRCLILLLLYLCIVIVVVVNGDRTEPCGDHATYTVRVINNRVYTLTINGTGAMYDYHANSDIPWMDYRTYLDAVYIEEGITSIGNYAFSGCMKITNITIPEGVKSIGVGAFTQCSNLNKIFLPESLEEIKSSAFRECSNVKSVDMPYGVKTIGAYSFSYINSLSSFDVPSSVTSIGENAFTQCSGLKSIVIPDSVVSIGSKAFSDCSSLKSVYYLGTNSITTSDAFSNTQFMNPVCVPSGYASDSFCGATATSSSECQSVFQLFNHCYEAVTVNGVFVQRIRKNATQWENQSGNCTEHHCINETGPASWSTCNSTDTGIFVCENDKCVEQQRSESSQSHDQSEEGPHDEGRKVNRKNWSVDIVMPDDVNETDINMTELARMITHTFKIDFDELCIELTTNKEGVLVVTLYVDDAQIANDIAEGLKQNCKLGVLCRRKTVHVYGPEQFISGSATNLVSYLFMMMLFFSMIMM